MRRFAVEVSVTGDAPIPAVLTDYLIAVFVEFTLESEFGMGDWAIAIAFVDEMEITRLHAQFMNLNEPTDILTFAYDEDSGLGGDIAICVPVAATQADDHKSSLERELCFLIVHGLLHLLYHDDRTEEMRGAMLSRQDQILDEWGKVSR